ncbi:MAG TPA: transglutaminase-like domain-containing protein [Gaiellales bacterium]|nr:transglutaminase-like domain-containing protein [Gaiellales bacterium]
MPDRRALGRRLPLLAALVVFGGWHWARLEHPQPALSGLALLTALGVLPAAVGAVTGRWRGRAAPLALAVAVAAVGIVTGLWPWQLDHPLYPRRVWLDLHDGISQWFSATTPFDPQRFVAVDHVVRLGYVALVAAIAWSLLRGRPLTAVAGAFVLYALPSTVLAIGSPVPRAVLFLALTLLVLRSCAVRSAYPGAGGLGQALGLGGAIVVAALVVGGAPGVTKAALFDWRHWNPLAPQGAQVSVAYVWNDTYGPLVWPRRTTTVLEVYAPRPSYWRAAVLNSFQLPAGRWVESARLAAGFDQSGSQLGLPQSALPPVDTATASPDLFDVRVVVEGLAGRELISAGQPILYSALPRGGGAQALDDGSALESRDVARGASYVVHVYQPNPTPSALEQAGTAFPAAVVDPSLVLGGQVMPVFGSAGAVPQAPLPAPFMRAAAQVWQRSGAATAANEYLAVALVEHYLRSRPFLYDQRPRYRPGLPVLVEFLTRSHRGYCQMFSASMAMVLRLHGIPARVAVGFTTGTAPSGPGKPYLVSDRDAHAWDEVYFPGYGWLPFDPTPTRSLPAQASTSNPDWSKAAASLATAGGRLTPAERSKFGLLPVARGKIGQLQHNALKGGPGGPLGSGPAGGSASGPASRSIGFVAWAALAAALMAGVLLAVKLTAVRWRYLRAGPRGQAAAAFVELATYVADQNLPVAAGASFDDLAADIGRAFAVDARPFARAAGRARYAPVERADRAVAEMRREMRRLRRELRRSLTRRERMAGSFRLRAAIVRLGDRG